MCCWPSQSLYSAYYTHKGVVTVCAVYAAVNFQISRDKEPRVLIGLRVPVTLEAASLLTPPSPLIPNRARHTSTRRTTTRTALRAAASSHLPRRRGKAEGKKIKTRKTKRTNIAAFSSRRARSAPNNTFAVSQLVSQSADMSDAQH